jgi:beta-galactosidase/beta-glucuronidase
MNRIRQEPMTTTPIPRPEHPRPNLERTDWINLNGTWSFSFDFGRSGIERGFPRSTGFDRQILVPFCPESALSGIGHTDFLQSVWYHRTIEIPVDWRGKRVLLHFGGVDFECHAYIDGRHVGGHFGGSSSFHFDITTFVAAGSSFHLVVHATDDTRSTLQGGGKQSLDYTSVGCFYTRTTGIWQTVWLEAVTPHGLLSYEQFGDIDSQQLHIRPHFFELTRNLTFQATASLQGQVVSEASMPLTNTGVLSLDLSPGFSLWSPGKPSLYDLELRVVDRDGRVRDLAHSYAGMRKIHVEGNRFFLNNEPIYLRFVLDQGYYMQGIWTAPSDEALRRDIELGLEAGFNGARLHQKAFEERFHYWADKLGYLTWAEYPSWGLSLKSDRSARNMLLEWREIVQRDKSHPSIIGWTPLNETWDISDKHRHRRLHVDAYEMTKALDPVRPVNGASGGCQVVTDIYTVHNYEQEPAKLRRMLERQEDGSVYQTLGDKEAAYSGQPYVVDEFGGIKWIPTQEFQYASDSWGYGVPPRSLNEFYERLEGQVNAILSLDHTAGYCYTQLTDVEQEQNGVYNYDRSAKFDMTVVREIFSRDPNEYQKEPRH